MAASTSETLNRRLNRISKRRKLELAAYEKLKALWLPGKTCVVCGKKNPDVHHSRGRISILLLLVQYWVPLCRADHSKIDADRPEARRLELLCQAGDWHRIPDEYKWIKNDLDKIVEMQRKLI